jgi:uncharacterized protein YgiM (DUF1202 family)
MIATSAIAEARILISRIPQDKASQARLARCNDLIARATAQLRLASPDYSAALFLALAAQEQASGRDSSPALSHEGAPPKKTYAVKSTANLRKGPSLEEPVVASLPAGTTVEALLLQGDWMKVQAGKDSGWVHRTLLE